MKNDVIYRQDAIDAIECIGSLDTEADKKYARSIFEALPSAQRWIPVSEKPIPKGFVFVTYNNGDIDLLSQPTAYRRGDIVAWMPSPKPWKGENNEYTN